MNKLYLISFSSPLKLEELSVYFDKFPEVKFWFSHMTHSMYISTSLSAQQLQEMMLQRFGQTAMFVIVEIVAGGNYAGWVPDEHAKYFP